LLLLPARLPRGLALLLLPARLLRQRHGDTIASFELLGGLP
jgi:hypothetical protein